MSQKGKLLSSLLVSSPTDSARRPRTTKEETKLRTRTNSVVQTPPSLSLDYYGCKLLAGRGELKCRQNEKCDGCCCLSANFGIIINHRPELFEGSRQP
jgi:hypothetical protein